MTRYWILRRSFVAGGLLVLALIGLSSAPARAQDVIKIAAGAPLTGPLAKQGQEVANAVKLAVDEWNAKGGVLGKKIEVVEADDQGNPQVGVAAGEKVAADPAVVGAVWGITSVTCIPVSEILERVNLVLITPGCSNPKVTDRALKTVNRLCARDDFQGPAGIIFLVNELKAKKIAIFDDGTTGPRGAADEAEKQAKAMGATALRFVIRSGDKDFRAILGTVPKDVNAIYASLWAPDAALIAKQLPDVGLNARMIGPDGQFEPVDYIQASGGARRGQLRHLLRSGHEEDRRGAELREGVRGQVRRRSAPTARSPMRPPTSCSRRSRMPARPIARRCAMPYGPPTDYKRHSGHADQLRRQGRRRHRVALRLSGQGQGLRARQDRSSK